MANSPSSRKRARQAVNRRNHNASRRSMLRTEIKKVVVQVESGDKAAAQAAMIKATPLIDRMASRGLIPKNKAARTKSRLSARIKALSA